MYAVPFFFLFLISLLFCSGNTFIYFVFGASDQWTIRLCKNEKQSGKDRWKYTWRASHRLLWTDSLSELNYPIMYSHFGVAGRGSSGTASACPFSIPDQTPRRSSYFGMLLRHVRWKMNRRKAPQQKVCSSTRATKKCCGEKIFIFRIIS